jgi:DNA-binding MarR family transcriptional regulator
MIEQDRVEQRIGYKLKRAQQALRRAMDQALRDLGVTTPQYAVLSFLASQPDLSNAELARRAFVTPQTMNEILTTLEANGLIARVARPSHGRILEARLTDPARQILAECHARIAVVEDRMVAALNVAERDQLANALQRCVDALEG